MNEINEDYKRKEFEQKFRKEHAGGWIDGRTDEEREQSLINVFGEDYENQEWFKKNVAELTDNLSKAIAEDIDREILKEFGYTDIEINTLLLTHKY